MKNLWVMGLIKTIDNKVNHIVSSDLAVVVQDKFPKAKLHYLVISLDDIPDIFHLKKDHLDLLQDMHLLAINIIELKRKTVDDFKIGFHARPSMLRLHLHVLSKDFVSDNLKTKKHYLSFNSRLFLPFEDVYKKLETTGKIKRLSNIEYNKLISMPMECNQCSYVAPNIPKLKEHLNEHWEKSQLLQNFENEN